MAIDVVPLLPGHHWHRVARAWRTPGLGELVMGFTGGALLRRLGGLSAAHAEEVLRHFDHGTQRAILKLYRAERTVTAPLDAVTAPALVVWGEHDRYLEPAWADRVATALGGPAEVEIVPGAGHWPWLDRPEPCNGSPSSSAPPARCKTDGARGRIVAASRYPGRTARRTASSLLTQTDRLGERFTSGHGRAWVVGGCPCAPPYHQFLP